MTEEFIAKNPGLILLIIVLLIGFIKCMWWVLSKLVTQPYVQLTTAIAELTLSVNQIRDDISTNQKSYQIERGQILDRLQKQETYCKTVHNFCLLRKDDNTPSIH